LREQGLNAWGYSGGYHLPPTTLTGSVRGDIVFVDALIGVGEIAISDHRSSQPTLDELLRLASEAHVAGLMTGKAGIVHLHLGDGMRGLELVRQALDQSELPARVFNPTHVNRRKALFTEAVDLARRGCSIDITAFPVDEGEDAWSAADALTRYFDSGAPPAHVTISSDAGGCLPCFDGDGRVCGMSVGESGALLATLNELLARGMALAQALPAFTSNPARLLRFPT
jgi:beta-aspartyl-dipeptidase (metallo-type)